MDRHGFVAAVHERYRPRNYLEIGVDEGVGLSQSRTRTIGVDPAYGITSELACDLQLVRSTSDDFFARPDALQWFAEDVIDFSFIDGMHLFEFALRDFMNAERLSSRNSVVILDDMLARSDLEAARERRTIAWTGDVYKVALALDRYRPDLVTVPINTSPTGLLLVLGLDPSSTVLQEAYDDIVAQWATPDPQSVPESIVHRHDAADPDQLLATGVFEALAAARDADGAVPAMMADLRTLRGTAQYTWKPPKHEPWPVPDPAATAVPEPKPDPPRKRPPAKKKPPPPLARRAVRKIRREVRRRLG